MAGRPSGGICRKDREGGPNLRRGCPVNDHSRVWVMNEDRRAQALARDEGEPGAGNPMSPLLHHLTRL